MNHLILTRLASGNPSTEWLKFRIKLFEEYCAPSLRAQTCKNFIWLLAVGVNTPKWFLDRVIKISPAVRFIYIKSAGYDLNWSNALPRELITPVLLTTRLDNDDALHRNFVEQVQRVAKEQKYSCALDAPLGYSLDQNTLTCYEYYSDCNHFITVLEFGTFQTAYCAQHKHIASKLPVLKFGQGTHLWVEGYHGKNVTNKLRYNRNPMHWNTIKDNFL